MTHLPRLTAARASAVGALLLGSLWAACASSGSGVEESPFLNAQPGVAFVGDEACASCHESEFAGYQEHGMARSFYPMTPERAVEDFSGVVITHPDGFSYTAYRRDDGRYVQEEFRTDAAGRKTHSLVRTIDYVVGSGNAARTYLTTIGGRLFQLPLTWYAGVDGRPPHWEFSPGYRETNGRFGRAIPDRCMACHNDYSEPVPFLEGAFANVADGIGCERCHGPGELHVDARLADETAPDSIDYTIVNPRWLSLQRRLDVCQQCHLSGAVSVQREGGEAFGFRPSQPLASNRALFQLVGTDPRRVSVISHADRMRRSRCFTESGSMECTTCHDPHEGFREAGPVYFNRRCESCHPPAALAAGMPTPDLRAQHQSGAACYSCHMPEVAADDVPHASFTDHYIRVVQADDRIVGEAVAGGSPELRPYFEGDEGDETLAGIAYVVYGRQRGDRATLARGEQLLAEALADRPEQGEAQFLLGFARLQLGRPRDAVPPLEEAVRLGPAIPERLNALAQALEGSGAGARAGPYYIRALEAQPVAADIRVNYGRWLESQGRLAEATEQYRRAATDDPTLAAAHYNLGTALARTGGSMDAVESLREAIVLEPDHADALLNLGALVASAGRVDEAVGLFRRAVQAAPTNPAAHANLALALAQQGQAAEARAAAQTALSLNPSQPTALQVLRELGG